MLPPEILSLSRHLPEPLRWRSRVMAAAALVSALGWVVCTPRPALGQSVLVVPPLANAADPSPHSDISWVSESRSVQPGMTLRGALRIRLDRGWHTYWRNGGDAGLPPVATWTLPEGASASPLFYPTPHRLPQPPLMSYGYEHEVRFPIAITVPASTPVGGTFHVAATVEWLACADVCLPASGEIAVSVPVRAAIEASSGEEAIMARWRAALPLTWAGAPVSATLGDSTVVLAIPRPASRSAPWSAPYFFADSGGVVEHAAPQRATWRGDTLLLTIPLSIPSASSARRAPLMALSGVLVTDASGTGAAWDITAAVSPAIARSSTIAPIEAPSDAASLTAPFRGATNSVGLWAALVFALLGGLVLNVMPCVFPVLSLKVLSLVGSEPQPAATRAGRAAAFTLGILVSLWTLGALLLLLRAGGSAVGWGFQMQSPAVVAALAVLLFLLGLNLSGLFEIGLALTRAQTPRGLARSGWRDAAATGMLTVVVATPCSAPFMGSAVGFALVQSPVTGMLVFTALGLGLALPVAALLLQPQWLRWLPAPGPWLAQVKQWLAWPMYVTVVWLLWVHARQTSAETAAALQLLLIVAAIGATMLGRAQRSFRAAHGRTGLLIIGAAWCAAALVSRPATVGHSATDGTTSTATTDGWVAFTPARFDSVRAAGHPVFVDYSAAWCLSCQVNERIVLQLDTVRRAFAQSGVLPMRADWTRRDSAVTRMITATGQAGVPLYVVYPAASSAPPTILPSVLTTTVVLNAISAHAASAAGTASRAP